MSCCGRFVGLPFAAYAAAVTCPRQPQLQARLVVAAGKGSKGKKKKKGKKRAASDSEDESGNPVPRIGVEPSTISSRKMIYAVREREMLDAKQQAMPHRRAPSNSKFSPSAAQERRSQQLAKEREQQQDLLEKIPTHISLRTNATHRQNIHNVYKTACETNAPVVIVDGYNVLHLLRKLKEQSRRGGQILKAREERDSKLAVRYQQEGLMFDHQSSQSRDADEMSPTELALLREELEKDVQAYADSQEFRSYVVWDSMTRAGEEADVTVEVKDDTLSVAYTAGMEADTHLGTAARDFLGKGARYVQVVTSDREAATLAGPMSHNVVITSSAQFAEEMQRHTKMTEEELVMNSHLVAAGGVGGVMMGALGAQLQSAALDPSKKQALLALMNGGGPVGTPPGASTSNNQRRYSKSKSRSKSRSRGDRGVQEEQ